VSWFLSKFFEFYITNNCNRLGVRKGDWSLTALTARYYTNLNLLSFLSTEESRITHPSVNLNKNAQKVSSTHCPISYFTIWNLSRPMKKGVLRRRRPRTLAEKLTGKVEKTEVFTVAWGTELYGNVLVIFLRPGGYVTRARMCQDSHLTPPPLNPSSCLALLPKIRVHHLWPHPKSGFAQLPLVYQLKSYSQWNLTTSKSLLLCIPCYLQKIHDAINSVCHRWRNAHIF